MKQEHLKAIIKTAVIAVIALIVAFNFDFFLDLALGILSIILTIAFVAVLVWFCVKFRIWEMVLMAFPYAMGFIGLFFGSPGAYDDSDVSIFPDHSDETERLNKEIDEMYERAAWEDAYKEQQYWDNVTTQGRREGRW